ncbi:MAG: c-type cytochrome [Luteolibacter sp.]
MKKHSFLMIAGALVPAFSGAAATDGVVVDPRFEVRELARGEEQPVVSPSAFSIDEQGRIFVAEANRLRKGVCDNRSREYWFLEDIASQTTADRLAMYQRWEHQLPEGYFTDTSDRVRMHVDTTGDGDVDKAQVFAEGFDGMLDGLASGVFAFEGAVYFANIPAIWKMRDSNGDGTADVREVVAEGFGVRVSFSGHDMNGFTLGPDGRIYGTIGDRGLSVTTREGTKYHYPDQGVVFRFDPDGSNFEVIHTGLRNPKELAFDYHGNLFTVDNNSDQGDAARIVYLTEFGDSGWRMGHQTMHSFHSRIGLERRPPNRWMDEKMWHERNPEQPLSIIPPVALLTSGPSGLTVHPGAGFCDSERGRFLICDYRGNPALSGVWSFEMAADGAGFKMTDSRWFMQGACATDVDYTWDGKVIVSDFIGGWQSHDDGRLLIVENPDAPSWLDGVVATDVFIREGFAHRAADELLALLEHPDMRVRLRAQIALTRLDGALGKLISGTARERGFFTRLHSVWGLGILARRGDGVPVPFPDEMPGADAGLRQAAAEALRGLIDDADAEIRAQTWRVLGESPMDGNALPIDQALADKSPRVRYFAAFAAAKLNGRRHFEAVCQMIRENKDEDVFLRHAGAVALAALATENVGRLAKLQDFGDEALDIAAVVAMRRLGGHEMTAFLTSPRSLVFTEALRAVCDDGISLARPSVARMIEEDRFKAMSPFMQRRLLHNAYRLGGETNARRLVDVLLDSEMPQAARDEAARLLGKWAEPHVANQFTGDHAPLDVRPAAEASVVLQSELPRLLDGDSINAHAALGYIGIYDLQVDVNAIGALAGRSSLAAETRAKALETLSRISSEKAEPLLRKLATDEADAVALMALRLLATHDPEAALPGLREAVSTPDSSRARDAWAILGGLPVPEADAIVAQSIINLTLRLGAAGDAIERLEAAEMRAASSPAVAGALKAYQQAVESARDPLAPWLAMLHGGDPLRGRRIFNSHPQGECMRCHRANAGHAAGGEAGPNLAGVANRLDRRKLLESLVLPDAEISPGFGTVSLKLTNEASISGTYHGGGGAYYDIATADTAHRVMAGDVKEVTFAPSAMPAMGPLLAPREMRDLVAWLDSLKGSSAEVPPGTPTTFPVLDPATIQPAAPLADAEALRKMGQQQYIMCAACHGQQGEGGPAGPPLAGSEWVLGPAENLIRIQLRGLQGPITVKGVEYNMVMPPMPYQNDGQIAAVLTYIRSSFGNEAPAIAPEDVAKHRDEVGKPMLTVDDLLPHGR